MNNTFIPLEIKLSTKFINKKSQMAHLVGEVVSIAWKLWPTKERLQPNKHQRVTCTLLAIEKFVDEKQSRRH